MAEAKNGDTVKVHYTGKLADGTQFDTSREGEPLQFTLGAGQVIPGFDQGIVGMNAGESKTISIPSAEAYGPYREEMAVVVQKSQLPDDLDPQPGQHLQINKEDQVFRVTVTEVSEDTVTLDANHPLAGKDLVLDVELMGIE